MLFNGAAKNDRHTQLSLHFRLCPVALSIAGPLRCAIFPLRHHVQLPKLCIGDCCRGAGQQALPRCRLGECDDVPDGSCACSTRPQQAHQRASGPCARGTSQDGLKYRQGNGPCLSVPNFQNLLQGSLGLDIGKKRAVPLSSDDLKPVTGITRALVIHTPEPFDYSVDNI